MKLISSLQEWHSIRKNLPASEQVGFVPTMGNLHQGHASLLKKSSSENDISVLSIFVNPTQFNDKQDFETYPKTLAQDCEIAKLCHVDFILAPQAEELYVDNYQYKISENNISAILEGEHRPGHFDGVLTIVMKLFHLVKPQRAYFGEKDYQQLLLIKKMVEAFFMDIEIVACPTVRLENGLAMSSRNNRLNLQQIEQSKLISQLLASGDTPQEISVKLKNQGFDVEYVQKWQKRIFAAVKIGNVRLIDNVKLTDRTADTRGNDR